MHMVKRFFGFVYMLAILPTFSGAFPRCGLCIANNGVANCRDLVAAPCIRILNYGAEDVRDILVGRCGQTVDPPEMAIFTKFKGKRCNSDSSMRTTRETPVTDSPAMRTTRETPVKDSPAMRTTRETPFTNSPAMRTTRETPFTNSPAMRTTRETPFTNSPAMRTTIETPVTVTDSPAMRTTRETPVTAMQTLGIEVDGSEKKKDHNLDPNLDDEWKGMLAWAVVTTIIVILILLKRWLMAKLKCQCCSCVPPAPSASGIPSAPPASSATASSASDTPSTASSASSNLSVSQAPPSTSVAHLNPAFTPQGAGLGFNILAHTPPSLATTPSTLSPTPPSTVRSNRPLISPMEPISARTRSKTHRKLSL